MKGLCNADVIRASARASRNMRSAFVDDDLVAVFGVYFPTVVSTSASPWLLATRRLEGRDARRAMVRHSPGQLLEIAGPAERLWNYVAAENDVAIRYLEWLGFTIDRHCPRSVRGLDFVPFHKELSHVYRSGVSNGNRQHDKQRVV